MKFKDVHLTPASQRLLCAHLMLRAGYQGSADVLSAEAETLRRYLIHGSCDDADKDARPDTKDDITSAHDFFAPESISMLDSPAQPDRRGVVLYFPSEGDAIGYANWLVERRVRRNWATKDEQPGTHPHIPGTL